MARTTKPKAAEGEDVDAMVMTLLADVERRKAEITKLSGKPSWRTNCSFSYTEGSAAGALQLNTLTDLRVLVSIASFLRQRCASYAEAAKELGVENPPSYQYGGFSYEDWMADLKLRVGKVQINQKQRDLDGLEQRLNLIVSPDQRRRLELKAIQAELASKPIS